jgi:hypothetical protein
MRAQCVKPGLAVHVGPLLAAAGLLCPATPVCAGDTPSEDNFARDRLVAWCVVPFDAKKRGPEERARMLDRLGIRRLAYDWRNEHVPTFEAEILALKKRGIEYFAFWGQHESMYGLIRKHGIRPQIWMTAPSPKADHQDKRVEAAGQQLLPPARRATGIGCAFGLYNHGGWGGEPGNLVAVCEWLKSRVAGGRIGIVYNLHHGHGQIDRFKAAFERMKPHLHCLNLNGMNDGAKPKILPVGEGKHEREMIRIVRDGGYRGPVGILDHRSGVDAEESLKQNLDGLKRVLEALGAGAAKTYR